MLSCPSFLHSCLASLALDSYRVGVALPCLVISCLVLPWFAYSHREIYFGIGAKQIVASILFSQHNTTQHTTQHNTTQHTTAVVLLLLRQYFCVFELICFFSLFFSVDLCLEQLSDKSSFLSCLNLVSVPLFWLNFPTLPHYVHVTQERRVPSVQPMFIATSPRHWAHVGVT